jgi:cytochrome c oxidase subunit IV
MSGHVSPKSVYYLIFGSLMVLTAVTVGVAFLPLGQFNFPVAIAIAITKATLVILFFMHVKYSSRLTKMVVGMAFFFLAILLGLTMTDYLSRGWQASARGTADAGTYATPTRPIGTPAARPAHESPAAEPAH